MIQLDSKSKSLRILPGGKRPWPARIVAYTPQAEYDLEREWVTLREGRVSLEELPEGVYEYGGERRGFFAWEGGQVTPLEKAQVVERLGAALDPRAEQKAELRRPERSLQRRYRPDRIHSDGDGMFDRCSEAELAEIEALERRIQTLKREPGEA